MAISRPTLRQMAASRRTMPPCLDRSRPTSFAVGWADRRSSPIRCFHDSAAAMDDSFGRRRRADRFVSVNVFLGWVHLGYAQSDIGLWFRNFAPNAAPERQSSRHSLMCRPPSVATIRSSATALESACYITECA